MNIRGGVLLRNVVFMIIVFAGIMAISSLAVYDMAEEYGNTNMTNEFTNDETSGLGDLMFTNLSSDFDTMKNASDPAISSFTLGTDVIRGAATIIKVVFTSPVYVANALSIMVTSLGVPTSIAIIVRNVVIFALYGVIIFGIITALLRGSKI